MKFLGSSIKPTLTLSVPETAGFCCPNSGLDVSKCNPWKKKVQKQLAKPIIYQRKRIPTSQYVDPNSKKGRFLVAAFSPKESGNYLVNAASDDEVLESEMLPSNDSPLKEKLQGQFDAFYRFSRPFAFVGIVWSLIAVSLLAVEKLSDFSPSFFIGLFQVLAAVFFTHTYSSGLNQLEDIEIDKVNKPYLPLASGEYSIRTGLILTLSSALMAFGFGWIVASPCLNFLILIFFVSSTAYSLNVPYLRWKRNAYLAALCIFIGMVPSGLAAYFHIQTFAFGRPAHFSKPVIFAMIFYSIITVVMALLKDIPDVAGDKIHGVRSFAVQFGAKKVFSICIYLLQIVFLAGVSVGLTSSYNWSKFVTVVGHLFLSLKLWSRARSVDVGSKEETTYFYLFFWKLIVGECFLIPLIR
ncbi:OLC1v1035781C1 [Oldenlandia corymbosa var. corymbosa]|uniref:OLC1v1035781C1 n=1 Tax=Oldenlandia corymbosa var. corymbosa TaxID=529605 RepID=A0AAV1CX63_OLDCO|nr:OLC1v1035781C1 [Oldenlandia corymbosa var. corymbosa]